MYTYLPKAIEILTRDLLPSPVGVHIVPSLVPSPLNPLGHSEQLKLPGKLLQLVTHGFISFSHSFISKKY